MLLAGNRQLDAMIKEGKLPNVLLLWGEDDLTITRYTHRLEKEIVTAFEDFNCYRCDGRTTPDLDTLGDSALALPMMAARRLALVNDLNPELLSAADFAKLTQLMEELPEETLLLITVRTVELDLKKKGSKGAKLYELCDRFGGVCRFTRPTTTDTARVAMATALGLGSKLELPDAQLLAEYCGRDSQRVLSETQKLAAHSPVQITREDIGLLVTPIAEAKVFDLSEKMIRKDYTAAFATIDELIFQREDPVTILTILTMAFVDIYRAAVARRARVEDAQAKKAYGYGGGGYRYDKGVQNQRQFSVPQLVDILRLLGWADGRMKATGVDPRVVLETTVAQIFQRMEQD